MIGEEGENDLKRRQKVQKSVSSSNYKSHNKRDNLQINKYN